MKIWYQSGTNIDKNPTTREYAATMNSYLNSIARQGTEVSVHGVEICSPYLDSFQTEEVLHSGQVLGNLVRAQREGYDAFCVGNAYDPAFYGLREVAEIPVCGLAEASMVLACLLAPNFSIMCHDAPLLRRVTELVKRYGFQDRFIATNDCHLPIAEAFKAFNDPEIFLGPAREVAREGARKGVTMFINGEGVLNMILAKYNVHEIEGIPILEGGGAIIKLAEMLVDLKKMGIKKSPLGLYNPVPKDHLASLLKMYGVK
ncbi:MAG: aspartate/glutamate racemase family protein [Chloroflexota bacterium]